MSLGFAATLDMLLEEQALPNSGAYANAVAVYDRLEGSKRQIAALENGLKHRLDVLCGALAVRVRRHQPGLNVSLHNGRCKIAYGVKSLELVPNIKSGMWDIDSSHPKFGSMFRRRYGDLAHLKDNLEPLALGIADFFNKHYKSIHEEITGVGTVVVEGLRVTYKQLVERQRAAEVIND